jgi:hypothetical protein
MNDKEDNSFIKVTRRDIPPLGCGRTTHKLYRYCIGRRRYSADLDDDSEYTSCSTCINTKPHKKHQLEVGNITLD